MANPYVVVDHIISDENQGINGTYNISFTELENGDRDAIAEWIGSKVTYSYEKLKNAPALPTSAITYSTTDPEAIESVAGFHRVAFSGDYNHLMNRPSLHSVAFSGDYNDLSNKPDSFSFDDLSDLPDFFSGKYEDLEHAPAIPASAKVFENGDLTEVQPFADIAFSGSYNDLEDIPPAQTYAAVASSGKYEDLIHAPGLPESAKIYSTTDPQIIDTILNFNDIAFTGNYDDLLQAPSIPNVNGRRPTAFNEVAFTGINSNVITSTVINPIISNIVNLNNYNGSVTGLTTEQNNENNNKLHNLGNENTYILGLNSFNMSNNSLVNALSVLVSDFITYKKPSYIISGQNTFFITDIKRTQSAGADSYYEIKISNQITSNYTNIRTIQNNITSDEAQTTLNNLNINSNIGILIVDINNNLIYYQKNDNVKKEDIDNYTFSPSAFIYRYDTTNNQNINMSQEDAELLDEVGFRKGYIKNIDQLYNNATIYTTDTAFTSVIENGLLAAFLDGKICYLQTRYDYYLITKIDHFRTNDTLAFMSIICSPVVDNNYGQDQLFNEPTTTDTEIETILNSLTCKMKVPCITIDFNKKILYSYYLEYIPE